LLTYGKEQAQPETWQHCQEPEKPRGQQMNKTSEKKVTIIFYFWRLMTLKFILFLC
jgi:hypothetical protein